jgi:hypothetical protein
MNMFIYLKTRLVLPLVAGVVLTIVALLPQTGWLARPSIQAAMGVWPESESRTLTDIGLKPVSLGVARVMASYTIPAASLLAIIFAITMPFLAHRQDVLREQVQEMATNEISFHKRSATAER